jgi:hypothetical protein
LTPSLDNRTGDDARRYGATDWLRFIFDWGTRRAKWPQSLDWRNHHDSGGKTVKFKAAKAFKDAVSA